MSMSCTDQLCSGRWDWPDPPSVFRQMRLACTYHQMRLSCTDLLCSDRWDWPVPTFYVQTDETVLYKPSICSDRWDCPVPTNCVYSRESLLFTACFRQLGMQNYDRLEFFCVPTTVCQVFLLQIFVWRQTTPEQVLCARTKNRLSCWITFERY